MSARLDDLAAREAIAAMLAGCPAIVAAGLELESVDAAALTVTLAMPLLPAHERAPGSGQFHGGPVATLVDTAGDCAALLGAGGGVPTVNLRLDYLRPCLGPRLRAVAIARRLGRTLATVDIDVLDAEGRLCALGRGTYSMAVG